MNSPTRRRWLGRMCAIGCAGLLSHAGVCPAADSFWNSNTGGNYTNTANWLAGAVPGIADKANFTNNASYTITWSSDVTNSNAFFNAQSGTVTLNVSPQIWSLLDSLVVGQLGATGSVTHTTGTIVITNAAGLGELVVGEAGRGTFTLAGGTVTADGLFATNVTATATNSIFSFNGGTLTTLAGSVVRPGLMQDGVPTIVIGSTATPAVWSILGGSNTITATALKLGRLSNGNRILVTGSNTVLEYTGGNFQIGEVGSRNQMVISNGARVNMTFSGSGAFIGMSGSGQSNSVIVTGANSLWNFPTGELGIGRGTGRDQLLIADGGEVRSLNGQIGVLAHSNSATVSGPGSRWMTTGTMLVGFFGGTNLLTITDGGVVSNVALRVGSAAGSQNNRVVVSGAGSTLYAPELYVGSNTVSQGSGIVIVTDGGTLESGALVSGRLSAGGTPSGVISNSGGVYQFTNFDPNVIANSTNSVVLHNGTISYRNIINANVFAIVAGSGFRITNMSFSGNNGFRLNHASNAVGVATYTFDTGLGSTNYSRLELQNNARWRSTTLRIGSGGSLIGNGTVESTSVTNLGTIAPGFSAGLLTFTSNLVLGASSRLELEIGGNNPADYDRLIVAGSVTVTGTLAVASINGFDTTPGEIYTLIDNQGTGPIFGQFDGLTNNAFLDASANGGEAFFRILYDGGTGNDLVLLATIPEPSAVMLVVSVCAMFARRRPRG